MMWDHLGPFRHLEVRVLFAHPDRAQSTRDTHASSAEQGKLKTETHGRNRAHSRRSRRSARRRR